MEPRPSSTPVQERQALLAALDRVAGGSEAALAEVYDRTSAKLFGICLRILGDRGEAEDALQEVYVSVWRRAGSFDASRASPITWLATLARNRAIDRLRVGRPTARRTRRSRRPSTCPIAATTRWPAGGGRGARAAGALPGGAGGPRPGRDPLRFFRWLHLCRARGARRGAAGDDEELGPARPAPTEGVPGTMSGAPLDEERRSAGGRAWCLACWRATMLRAARVRAATDPAFRRRSGAIGKQRLRRWPARLPPWRRSPCLGAGSARAVARHRRRTPNVVPLRRNLARWRAAAAAMTAVAASLALLIV